MEIPSDHFPPQRTPLVFHVLLGLMALAVVSGFFLKGEWEAFFAASREGGLMALLGVLAYKGLESRIARTLAWLVLGVLLAFIVVCNAGLAVALHTSSAAGEGIALHSLPPGAKHVLAGVAAASVMAALTALLPHHKSFRRLCSALTGNEEWTSVRVMALGGVTAITLLLFVPLVALGEAPLSALLLRGGHLTSILFEKAADPSVMLRNETLRNEMYSMCWNLLAATLAVGFGVRRNWRESLDRLGMVRLSPRQIGVALGLTALVFALSEGVDFAISHVWNWFHWPTTGGKDYEAIFKAFSSPAGAVVLGITAGFGEEVVIRGILQPRLGIVLSTLYFTALHAYQYNWDALLSVFVFGLALGLIRKKTSTSVCVVVHGSYDFVVMMIDVLSK